MRWEGIVGVRRQNVKVATGWALARAVCAFGLTLLLAVAFLAVIPLGASTLVDAPMPAWAGGVDEAVADEGTGASDSGDAASSADSDAASAESSAATQTAADGSAANAARTADGGTDSSSSASSQSSSSSSRASGAGSSTDRGYVGPWYALNSSYVVQVEERFDSIAEDEYMSTVLRTALIAVAAVTLVLAVVMFVRAGQVKSRIAKRRR